MVVAGFSLIAPLTFVSGSVAAQGFDVDDGHVTIDEARLTRVNAGWQLDARAEIRLSSVMRAGLDSGVPLEFVVDIALREPRDWWFDRTVFLFERRYTLNYYELTRHYRLQSSPTEMIKGEPGGRELRAEAGETADNRNFRSLLVALDAMGTLRGIALPAARPTRPGERRAKGAGGKSAQGQPTGPLIGELAIRLDDSALPLPLQPVFSSTWRLASEEYVWPVN